MSNWNELQDSVAMALSHKDAEPVSGDSELSVLDVLSGMATWDEFDATTRMAGADSSIWA